MENQRVYLTKKLLEKALIELLKTKSIYDISIRELCDVAMINRSTFYKHFSSQFELLNYMEDNLLERVSSYLKFPSNSVEAITKNLVSVLKYLKENKDFSKLLLNNNVDKNFPNKFLSVPGITNAISSSVGPEIKEPIRAYYISFLVAGCFSVIKTRLNNNCVTNENIIASLLVNITMMNGVEHENSN